jgi:sugar phosphate isomerase/epimerase
MTPLFATRSRNRIFSHWRCRTQVGSRRTQALIGRRQTDRFIINAHDGVRLIRELRSNRIRIIFDPANLYRPPMDPRRDRHVITDALRLLGDHIAIAHCKDIADPTAKRAGHQDCEGPYAHVAAGTGILDYHHYISELERLVPRSIPLILHGLNEEQIPASVSFIQNCQKYLVPPGKRSTAESPGRP